MKKTQSKARKFVFVDEVAALPPDWMEIVAPAQSRPGDPAVRQSDSAIGEHNKNCADGLVAGAIQVCYHLPVPRLTARLAAQRIVDPATRLCVDPLPDRALAFARQSALRIFREENGLAFREENGLA